ncbi:hypothetical protein HY358_01745, partial [Candidatus Roizmanbacteria bacterium]|nr:hypothetical protein [Candidatus Roizmanbacteria bacterium]
AMFEFHDETQAARIQQFALSLQYLKIPPRVAPDFSFGMGYPIFNFYAPASYWITSAFHLVGLDIVASLKLSFLLSIIAAFVFSFFFLRNFFKFFPSLFGSVIYASSLYFAIDIFIRGNLAETWFLSVIPLVFHVIYRNAKKSSPMTFAGTAFVLSVALTMHNLLSLIFLPIVVVYISFLDNKKRNLLALVFALLASSYFLLPLILEVSLTYAADVARETKYFLHFLCPYQLWQSNWGFGGSAPGCAQDGMPFKIGKLQLTFFALGTLLFIANIRNRLKTNAIGMFFLTLTIGSLFLTMYQSQFVWDLTLPISAFVQFPWRFISFSIIGIAYFAAFAGEKLNVPYRNIVLFGVILGVLIINGKYFDRPQIDKKKYEQTYLSKEYIRNVAAYRIPEYLPRSAYYDEWKQLEDRPQLLYNDDITTLTPFHKTVTVPAGNWIKLPIHYFPTWILKINNEAVVPKMFGENGQPIVRVERDSFVDISYQQTTIERLANGITIATVLFLTSLLKFPALWKKMKA